MENKKWKYCFGAISLGAVFFAGLFLGKFIFNKPLLDTLFTNESESVRNKDKGNWNFINPLLDCGELANVSNKDILRVKEVVDNFIEEQKNENKVDSVAIYFRDLNNGPWFGISEKDNFYPASLLKVPLMISVLKQAMKDPSFLGKQFVWHGESKNNEYFKATNELKNNSTYSVGDALTYMIKYSDNNSAEALVRAVDAGDLAQSYSDLGIAFPQDQNYEISVRTYASFFRVLFNSTFLSKEYSEDALHLLSDTIFNQGLVSGVPASVKVAHKFGERQLDGNNVKQLHDCGIIYYPNQPYLLCIMTRGKDFDKMASVIGGISKIVYQTVDKDGVGLGTK